MEKHICPYCGSEMELGYIQTERTDKIFWLPEGKKVSFFNQSILRKMNGFLLGDHGMFGKSEQPAWCCRSCKKLVVDYKE